jgi:hypothetical protein
MKITLMTDGSIEEELFDGSVISKLLPEDGNPQSLTAFVNQARNVSVPVTTGSAGSGNQFNSAGAQ